MSEMFDVSALTPEQIASLRMQLGLPADSNTRSPMFQPLRDLRMPTTVKGRLNRPHFEWSAETPPEGVVIPPFPCLVWDPQGVEHRAESQEHLTRLLQPGWSARPPLKTPLTREEQLRAELAQLSPEDREFLLKTVKQARIDTLKAQMVGLSHDDIAALLPPPVEKGTKKTA